MMTSRQQREVIQNLKNKNVRLVFYDHNPEFDDFPHFSRRPILTQFLYKSYRPCESLGDGLVVLVRNDFRNDCDPARLKPEDLRSAFPSLSRLGFLPGF